MKTPALSFALLPILLLALPVAGLAADDGAVVTKRDVIASRLVLPYYEVDTNDPSGTTTSLAVRNETSQPVTVDLFFYEPDSPQAPQKTVTVDLAAKEVYQSNLRDVENLEVDPDGFARGYVVIEEQTGSASLSGDVIFITPGQDFATATQLVNGTPDSLLNELCSIFSIRWLRGPFDAESVITLWIDTDEIPTDPNVVTYTIYDDAGNDVFTHNLPLDLVTTRVTVDDLLGEETAGGGAVEIQISNDLQGHVSVSIDAFGRFSGGFEGFCKD